jgi:hypothetical protein
MAAKASGTAEGIYSCHPRQMITKKPLNINDEAVFDGMNRDEQPPSQPTMMSNTMQIIRLAEISRGIVDRSPLAMAHTGGLSHDAVMHIDTELQSLINDVPAFYSMQISALTRTFRLTQTEAEIFVCHGKTIHFVLYLQRCKLHLPYFARGFEDPAYFASREICLRHARLIIQSELWQEISDIDTALRLKFTGVLTGVFLACIVLLMDLCVNPLSPESENQRDEVQKSFKILDNAKNESEITAEFVGALVHVLQKHSIVPLEIIQRQQQPAPEEGSGSEQHSQEIPRSEMAPNTNAPGYRECDGIPFPGPSQSEIGISDDIGNIMGIDVPLDELLDQSENDFSSYWNSFTQHFEQGIDINNFDWDNMFLELDSSFV